MKMFSPEFIFVLGTGLGLFLVCTVQVSAQPLTKDTPTGNLTGEVDISIDPAEPLPANGTSTINTEGATDTDMNGFPPEGVYVIISSDIVIVTNQTVDIGTAEVENEVTGSVGGLNGGSESVDSSDDDEAGGDDDEAGGDDDEAGGDDDEAGGDDDEAGGDDDEAGGDDDEAGGDDDEAEI
jgi:hypothetical protein